MPDNHKPIHFHLFNPTNAIFKSHRSNKAECQVVNCCNSGNCGLYKRGQCAYISSFSWHKCPYGNYNREEGYTKNSKKFYSWISEKNKQYEGVPYLQSNSEMMTIIGDYVFLPYSFMTMCESVPFLAKGGIFSHDNCFLHKDHFTVENILKLVEFRPQALMGGEIEDYRKKSVPLFISHLSEVMPDLYEQVWNVSRDVKCIAEKMTSVGRKARLRSITPNVGLLRDIHGGTWIWDGEFLTCTNRNPSFMLVDKVDEIRLRPKDNPIIEITDNGQVNADTEFLS